MFGKILVPLDGSKLAECALPYAEELASDDDTREIILVTVTERIVGLAGPSQVVTTPGTLPVPEPVYQVPVALGKKQQQGERYLHRIAKRLEDKGIKVRIRVLLGNPAEQIATYAERYAADVIVMSSHGRSGPSRWAYGSVADKVFRASCIPILMVRAPGCIPGV